MDERGLGDLVSVHHRGRRLGPTAAGREKDPCKEPERSQAESLAELGHGRDYKEGAS